MKNIDLKTLTLFTLLGMTHFHTASANTIWGGKCNAETCNLRVKHVTATSTKNGKITTEGWVFEACGVVKVKSDAGEATARICGNTGKEWKKENGTGVKFSDGLMREVTYRRGCNAKIWTHSNGLETDSKVNCPRPDPNTGKPVTGNWK